MLIKTLFLSCFCFYQTTLFAQSGAGVETFDKDTFLQINSKRGTIGNLGRSVFRILDSQGKVLKTKAVERCHSTLTRDKTGDFWGSPCLGSKICLDHYDSTLSLLGSTCDETDYGYIANYDRTVISKEGLIYNTITWQGGEISVHRYLQNGQQDRSFQENGVMYLGLGRVAFGLDGSFAYITFPDNKDTLLTYYSPSGKKLNEISFENSFVNNVYMFDDITYLDTFNSELGARFNQTFHVFKAGKEVAKKAIPDIFRSVAFDSKGRLIAFMQDESKNTATLARYFVSENGLVNDPSFGTDGTLTIDFKMYDSIQTFVFGSSNNLSISATDDIMITAGIKITNSPTLLLKAMTARVTVQGVLDRSLGTDGLAITDIP